MAVLGTPSVSLCEIHGKSTYVTDAYSLIRVIIMSLIKLVIHFTVVYGFITFADFTSILCIFIVQTMTAFTKITN